MRFRILGPFEGDVDGTPLVVSRRRERRLLIVLLLHPGEVVATDRLLDLLWDGDGPDLARSSLHSMVSRLRALVGRHRLVAERGGYRLDVDPAHTDAGRFRALVARADAETSPGRRRDLLRDALDLWRGELPEDLAAGGLFAALTAERFRATGDWLAAGLELGRHAELLPELTRLAAEHPDVDRFTALRMLALHRSGRTAEALTAYEETRRRLAADATTPGVRLRETYLSVLRDEAPATTPAPPARPPAQLPADPAGFVGRTAPLRALDRLRSHPVVLVTGPAGVGKTALATRWARRNARRYPDGQLHIDLRGYDRPVPALETLGRFLRALGVPADQVPGEVTEASAALRGRLSGTRTLLVLDNASSPEQIRPLLPDSPGCLLLVTSRDRLPALERPPGEAPPAAPGSAALSAGPAREGPEGLRPLAVGAALPELDVGRLGLEVLGAREAEELLAQIVGAERLRAEPEATAGLVAVCARLPLALRIAAAHLADRPGMTVAEQLAQLRESDALAELAIDGDPQSAVRAAFDQSYASLEPDVRRMFRLVGVLAAPDFGVASAAVLADVEEVEAGRLLERLAGAHLISERADGRYTRHDLMLSYSRQRSAEEPGLAPARTRLYEWQARTAASAAVRFPELTPLSFTVPQISGFDDLESALSWLDDESPQLWHSVTEAAGHGHPALACVLAEALRPYVERRGEPSNMLEVSEAHVSAAHMTGNVTAEATALANLGQAKREINRLGEAVEHFDQAQHLLGVAGDRRGQASRMITLGIMLRNHGQMARSIEIHRRSLAIQIELDVPVDASVTRTNIAHAHAEQGRAEEALAVVTESVRTMRELRSPAYLAGALLMSGKANVLLGRHDQAIVEFTESVTIYRGMHLRMLTGWAMAQLAEALALGGRGDEARDIIDIALEHLEPRGAMHRARGEILAGATFRECGEPDRARRHFSQGLSLARAAGTPYMAADALVGLAGVTSGTESRAHAEAALAITREYGYARLTAEAERVLAGTCV
ncbi:BTAD domain-containing putative transcriptional regulator [Longispora sp. NPDC051575]|uniref:AfsR/SARP family transcriptional regulator n=1 Tax=Longispora sp. NPDC051575 TaxID=3154943 RepID=UPI00342034A7